MKNKKCITCKESKPLSDYPVDKSTYDGLRGKCRQCMAERRKELYSKSAAAAKYLKHGAKNRDKINAARRKLHAEKKEKLGYLASQIPTSSIKLALQGLKTQQKRQDLRRLAPKFLGVAITNSILVASQGIQKQMKVRKTWIRRSKGNLKFKSKLLEKYPVKYAKARYRVRTLIQRNYPDNLKAIRDGREVALGNAASATDYILDKLGSIYKLSVSNTGVLETACKLCGTNFVPSYMQVTSAIHSINITGEYYNFYCSRECRGSCTLTNDKPIEFVSHLLKLWADAVKDRDDHKCQICGATTYLHAHHIKPRATNPLMTYDIDNGLTVCRSCHISKVHTKECSTAAIGRRACKVKSTRKKFRAIRRKDRGIKIDNIKLWHLNQAKELLKVKCYRDLSASFLSWMQYKHIVWFNLKLYNVAPEGITNANLEYWLYPPTHRKLSIPDDMEEYKNFIADPNVVAIHTKPDRFTKD